MPKVLYISFLRSEIATGNSSPFNQTRLGFAIFALYEWDLDPNFEIEIKEKFKATTRCIPNS
jgi:hypothetical protein